MLAALLVGQAVSPVAADEAFSKNDFVRAKALYQDELKANPKDSHALYRLAYIAARQGDAAEALADLKRYSDMTTVPIAAYRGEAFAVFAELPGYDTFVAALERKRYPCRFDGPARAMDRWIGEWSVTNPNGPGGASSSTIEREFDGCVIVEHWRGYFGDRGASLTSYDVKNQQWLQHYVSDTGVATDYVGHSVGNAVSFLTLSAPGGGAVKMTYTFLPDGRVEQRFDASSDGGKTWAVAQTLYYSRPSAPKSHP